MTFLLPVSSFRLSCSLLSCDIAVVVFVVVVVVSFPLLSSSPPFEPVSEANADLRSTREILFERLPLAVDPP